MPFFLSVNCNYKTSSAIFLGVMLLSYAMVLAANGIGLSWVGIVVFLVGFWQMAVLQFKAASFKPYKPPFLEWASEEIEMDEGTKKLNRMVHVSFWGLFPTYADHYFMNYRKVRLYRSTSFTDLSTYSPNLRAMILGVITP